MRPIRKSMTGANHSHSHNDKIKINNSNTCTSSYNKRLLLRLLVTLATTIQLLPMAPLSLSFISLQVPFVNALDTDPAVPAIPSRIRRLNLTDTNTPTNTPSSYPSAHPSQSPTVKPVAPTVAVPIPSPAAAVALEPATEPQTISKITMTLTGCNPLSPSDIQYFTTKTQDYIIHYYNTQVSVCDSCLQKDIDVKSVVIDVVDQDPPFENGDDENEKRRGRNLVIDAIAIDHAHFEIDIDISNISKSKSKQISKSNSNSNSEQKVRQRKTQGNNTSKLTITYSQTTSYQKVKSGTTSQLLETNNDGTGAATATSILSEIVKEPFNNISKRRQFKEYIKTNENDDGGDDDVVPIAFESLSWVSAPTIKEDPSSFFTIGVIAAFGAGGLLLIVGIIILICYCRQRNNKSIQMSDFNGNGNASGSDGDYLGNRSYDHHQPNRKQLEAMHKHKKKQHKNGGGRFPEQQLPSQVNLQNGIKDEDGVSTIMVDPSPQGGVFSGSGQSLKGYKDAQSVATFDPDYVGIYSGGAEDPSVVSSAGGTLGDATQKSKFSTLGSVLVGMNGDTSMYTEDEQAFEDHLRRNNQGQNGALGRHQKENYFDIYAPGGKLGVVIDTPNSGAPVVHNIKETCPIADQLRVGDKLIAVDDEDVRSMTAVKVSKLISQKSNNPTRKFTISRIQEEDSSP